MKHLLTSSMFCCIMTGFLSASASDMVPFIQDVATGLAVGAGWAAGGVAAGTLTYNLRILYFNRHAASYTLQGESIYRGDSDSYAMACVRAGAVGGVLHGLKYMGIDESYMQGAAAIGGALVALKQAHRVFRPQVSQTWYNALLGWIDW